MMQTLRRIIVFPVLLALTLILLAVCLVILFFAWLGDYWHPQEDY